MEELGSNWADFHEIWYSRICRKPVEKNSSSLKSGILHEEQRTFIISVSFLHRMKRFHIKVVEHIKTHILCSIIFFLEKRVVYDVMWE